MSAALCHVLSWLFLTFIPKTSDVEVCFQNRRCLCVFCTFQSKQSLFRHQIKLKQVIFDLVLVSLGAGWGMPPSSQQAFEKNKVVQAGYKSLQQKKLLSMNHYHPPLSPSFIQKYPLTFTNWLPSAPTPTLYVCLYMRMSPAMVCLQTLETNNDSNNIPIVLL